MREFELTITMNDVVADELGTAAEDVQTGLVRHIEGLGYTVTEIANDQTRAGRATARDADRGLRAPRSTGEARPGSDPGGDPPPPPGRSQPAQCSSDRCLPGRRLPLSGPTAEILADAIRGRKS